MLGARLDKVTVGKPCCYRGSGALIQTFCKHCLAHSLQHHIVLRRMYAPADHVAVVPLQRVVARQARIARGLDGQFDGANGV